MRAVGYGPKLSPIDDRIAHGRPHAVAENEAIAQFGTPRQVAGAFTTEPATAYARRTIAA